MDIDEAIDKANYLLDSYKDGCPVFPIGSYEYRAMTYIIDTLQKVKEKKA